MLETILKYFISCNNRFFLNLNTLLESTSRFEDFLEFSGFIISYEYKIEEFFLLIESSIFTKIFGFLLSVFNPLLKNTIFM